jgi:hypothetical protein
VRAMRTVLASLVLLLALAAPARADVLVNAPKRAISCGERIEIGVWYRDHPTTGHRRTTVEVLSARGIVLFKRTLLAPPEWKFWHYKPRCGRSYTVRYVTYRGTDDFRVRVHAA